MNIPYRSHERLERLDIEIFWINHPSGDSEGLIRYKDGTTIAIGRLRRSSMVQVKNGPFFTGREWFIIGNDPVEYDNLDEAVEAHRPGSSEDRVPLS